MNEGIIEKVRQFAYDKHQGQVRKFGSDEPYINHPVRVPGAPPDLYKEDTSDPEVIEKYKALYEFAPLVEGRDGLKYPEIKLGPAGNLQLLHPLKITCGFTGLVTSETGSKSYYQYSWRSKARYHEGEYMTLKFSAKGLEFTCEKYKGKYMPEPVFKYFFPSYIGVSTYISNQGRFYIGRRDTTGIL
jgi:hypothetical protein